MREKGRPNTKRPDTPGGQAGKNARLSALEEKSPVLTGADEIAAYLRCDTKTVRTLIEDGTLKVQKVRGTFKATEMQLERFIEGSP